MVEAVIVLPVLAAIAGGVWYLSAVGWASATVRQKARRCAFQHAALACPRTVAAGCEGLLQVGEARRGDEADAVQGALDRSAGHDGSSLVSDVGVMASPLNALVGLPTTASARSDFEFGRHTTTLESRFTLLCNAEPINPIGAVRDAFCRQVGLPGCGQ